MLRISFVLLLMIGVLCSTAVIQSRCPRNQEWTNCGSACPRSCNSSPHQVCTAQCVRGCQCRNGFLLNSAGNCVRPDECRIRT